MNEPSEVKIEGPTRPEWRHETPEGLARWLLSGFITKITHHWEMTGADTSRDWICLHKEGGEKRKIDTRFFSSNNEFQFSPDHACLVREAPYAGVRKSIDEIDNFEKANKRDRAEFERLKKKFAAVRTYLQSR